MPTRLCLIFKGASSVYDNWCVFGNDQKACEACELLNLLYWSWKKHLQKRREPSLHSNEMSEPKIYTHTHTHTHIYIYSLNEMSEFAP